MTKLDRRLVVKVTHVGDGRQIVEVDGACNQDISLALMVAATEMLIKTSGLTFDCAVRELARVMEQNEPIFEPSDFLVEQ
jgi:hypothetical protein